MRSLGASSLRHEVERQFLGGDCNRNHKREACCGSWRNRVDELLPRHVAAPLPPTARVEPVR